MKKPQPATDAGNSLLQTLQNLITRPEYPMNIEQTRLAKDREGKAPWKNWGPYLNERQWETVREDSSPNGDARNFFTHDHARARAYHWGEDGIAGISDGHQHLCFALAMWNGKDGILKERLFGLTNSEGIAARRARRSLVSSGPPPRGPARARRRCSGSATRITRKIYLYPNSHAGYYPGAKPIAMKVLFRKSDVRLLGAQPLWRLPFPRTLRRTLRQGNPALRTGLSMKRHTILILLGLSLVSCATSQNRVDAPTTAKVVDLSRYTGRWFEIARLPMPFQKADEAAIAEYERNADGTVSVHNIAIRPDGSQHDIRGFAKVLNPPENTKLAVRFDTWFGPLIPVPKEGNYWILHVDPRYQEAIVGTPDRKYLWLLARTSTIPEHRYAALVARAERLGFDVARLLKTAAPANSPPAQSNRRTSPTHPQ